MSTDRLKRVNELLRREIAASLFHVIHEPDFDLSAVTVTHVVASRSLREARVFISIRDHENEREKMLTRLRRYRSEIQDIINRNIVLKFTPRLSFELDLSLEKGDRVLGLLFDLEEETADDQTPQQQGEES